MLYIDDSVITNKVLIFQSVGRFFVLFLAITPHEELQKSVLVVVLFLTWSLSENVRQVILSSYGI